MDLRTFITDKWWPVASVDLQADWRTTIERWHLPVVLSTLGDYAFESLTREVLEVWWVALRREKTPGIANKILITVKSIFTKAEGWNYVTSSPARHLRKAKGNKARSTVLSAQHHELLRRDANPRLAPYLTMVRFTGARRKSLLGLRWRDIDFAGRTVTFVSTKNGDDQVLPLHPTLVKSLRTWKGKSGPNEYVLPRYRPQSLSRAFKRLAGRHGFRETRFHDTRHSAASHLAEKGASLVDIQAFLGHRDLRSTMRYVHSTPSSLERTVAKL